MTRFVASLAACALVLAATGVSAQQNQLQLKVPIERPIAMKESPHEYVVTSRANQALQIVVQQHGADVVVTVSAPDGKQLVEVDSASEEQGMGGAETAQVRALSAGDTACVLRHLSGQMPNPASTPSPWLKCETSRRTKSLTRRLS